MAAHSTVRQADHAPSTNYVNSETNLVVLEQLDMMHVKPRKMQQTYRQICPFSNSQ